MLKRRLTVLRAYLNKAQSLIDPVTYFHVLRDIYEENKGEVRDISLDIYCPKTYSHHTRFTTWFPPSYLEMFSADRLARYVIELLRKLRVRRSGDYVAGINSKLDQYKDTHLLMFDIDSLDPEVEETLSTIGGVVFKSGRGYHFIAKSLVSGRRNWERKLRRFLRSRVLGSRLDKAHIMKSIDRGYSTLRITSSPIKPATPIFYKEI